MSAGSFFLLSPPLFPSSPEQRRTAWLGVWGGGGSARWKRSRWSLWPVVGGGKMGGAALSGRGVGGLRAFVPGLVSLIGI